MKSAAVVLVHPSTQGGAALANTLAGSEHLGIAYLAAALSERLITHAVVDLEGNGSTPRADAQNILARRPKIVGFSPTSKSAPNAIELGRILRAHAPDVLQLWGGHLASGLGAAALTLVPELDGVVIGQGEQLLPHIVKTWLSDRFVPVAAGVVWSDRRPARAAITRRYPDWTQLLPERTRSPEWYAGNGARIVTSLGCPYDCSFCTTPGFSQRRVTRRTPSSVVEEMHLLQLRFGVTRFWFNDDLFIDGSRVSKARAREIASAIAQLDPRTRFRILSRSDTFVADPQLLDELHAAGLDTLYVGLESGDDDALREISKRTTAAVNYRLVEMLRDRGIFLQPGFIMFTPHSTVEGLRRNVAFLRDTGLLYRAFPLTRTAVAFPGTDLWPALEGNVDDERSTPFVRYSTFDSPAIRSLSVAMEVVEELFSSSDRTMYRAAAEGLLTSDTYSVVSSLLTDMALRMIDASIDGESPRALVSIAEAAHRRVTDARNLAGSRR